MELYRLADLVNLKKIEEKLLSIETLKEKREYLNDMIQAINDKIQKYNLDDNSIPTIFFSMENFPENKQIKIIRRNMLFKSKYRLIDLLKEYRIKRDKKLDENKFSWMGNDGDLIMLFNKLKSDDFLHHDTKEEQFLSFFSQNGRPYNNKKCELLVWKQNESHLVYLINKLKERNGDIGIIETKTIWKTTSNVFKVFKKGGELSKPNILSVTSSKLLNKDRGIPIKIKKKLDNILTSIIYAKGDNNY